MAARKTPYPRGRVVVHGTYAGYTHGGCRCAECRDANRIACWLRRNGYGPGRRPKSHGITLYNGGCRCDVCRAAKAYWARHCYERDHRRWPNPGHLSKLWPSET